MTFRVRRKQVLAGLFLLVSIITLGVLVKQPTSEEGQNLAKVHDEIIQNYPEVEHVSGVDADSASDTVLYLDIREVEEYTVSHLENAIRIDPDISADEFEKQFADKFSGKKLIFYCSVGVRSSELIDRLESVLARMDQTQAVNLEGGIFDWHNRRGQLYNENTKTDNVHPYSEFWSRLLERRDLVVYEP